MLRVEESGSQNRLVTGTVIFLTSSSWFPCLSSYVLGYNTSQSDDRYGGGSRGGAPGVHTPLFLDQTEARRTEKNFFGDPPFLRVWITPLISRSGSGTALSLERNKVIFCQNSHHVWLPRGSPSKVWSCVGRKYLSLSIGLGECSCLATREHVTNHHKPAWLFERPFRGQEMLLVINFEDKSTFNRIWMWVNFGPWASKWQCKSQQESICFVSYFPDELYQLCWAYIL